VLAGLWLAVSLGCQPEPAAPAEGRNVVLIVIDTLRPDRLPIYGCERQTAPFLDGLASRSLVFLHARSASSWTAPAMASIFTSTYPNQHGVVAGMIVLATRAMQGQKLRINRLPETLETIPIFMERAGYATFGVSANPNVGRGMGFTRGFERFSSIPYTGSAGTAGEVVDALLEWKQEILRAERFFLYLHLMDPHEPYRRHEEWIAPGALVPHKPMEDLAAYDSEIRYLDNQLRRLFEELDLGRETLVLVTSDHGQEFREHGGLGHGFKLYPELTRVPLILHLPGENAPTGRIGGNVSTLDILPTLRRLLGAPPSSQDVGVALLDPGKPISTPERELFAMRTSHYHKRILRKRSVLRGSLELIVSEPRGRAELYDLASDPGAHTNLAEAHPAKVRALRAALDAQESAAQSAAHATVGSYEPTQRELEALRTLGYVESDD
jgi:arylsulfatase A-like enzyme